MKKAISILVTVLVAMLATAAHASERGLTLLLSGDAGANGFSIELSEDGRYYLIEANAPLEVGGGICTHIENNPNLLQCEAAAIVGFELNGAGGDDRFAVSRTITAPATLRGGPGRDILAGGGGSDKILGGSGNDKLIGQPGDDWLFGGPGADRLYGGAGNDRLAGGPGEDLLVGGPGHNTEAQ